MALMLITGGSGYLGSELIRRASLQGWQLAATYHTHQPTSSQADFFGLDLRDAVAVEQLIHELRPASVIHTAYLQSGPDLWSITAEGSAAVARAAAASGARLIHLSSDVVFDGERLGAYTEQDAPAPISDYGSAKAAAERMVAAAHSDSLIVRTSLIYGGNQPSLHEQFVYTALDQQRDVAFYDDEYRCPIQVGDLADLLLEAATGDRHGILHAAGTDIVSRYEFACLVAKASGRNPELLKHAHSPGFAGGRPRNCALDTTLARSLFSTPLRGARQVLQSVPIRAAI